MQFSCILLVSLLYSARLLAKLIIMNTPTIKLDGDALAQAMPGSVAENARKLGISRQHLNNILKGNKNPSANLLLRLQKLFKLSADSISKKSI